MRMACTALSIVPWAVTTNTAMVRESLARFSSSSNPPMRGIFMSVTTMDGDQAATFSSPFDAVTGGFCPVAPGGKQLCQASALVFFVFDDQYFFLAHNMGRTFDVIIEALVDPCKSLGYKCEFRELTTQYQDETNNKE